MTPSFLSPVFIVIESIVQIAEQQGRARSKVEIDMRKRQISQTPSSEPSSSSTWLDVEHKAVVEVTSEENGFPIESALLGVEGGWRAANAGAQTIRLIFDEPQRLRRICLVFEDSENVRTQEFVLRWSSDNGNSFREIVRQQWNFSPSDSIREAEDYAVELSGVTALELIVVPDKSGSVARASLASLRLA
jgi:hypothetical protein